MFQRANFIKQSNPTKSADQATVTKYNKRNCNLISELAFRAHMDTFSNRKGGDSNFPPPSGERWLNKKLDSVSETSKIRTPVISINKNPDKTNMVWFFILILSQHTDKHGNQCNFHIKKKFEKRRIFLLGSFRSKFLTSIMRYFYYAEKKKFQTRHFLCQFFCEFLLPWPNLQYQNYFGLVNREVIRATITSWNY